MRFLARVPLLLVLACGGELPGPTYVQQRGSALASVPYPPPPARVEFVPSRPVSGAVWIDGEWAFRGRRWSWRPGRWVVPPAGARFSPWTMVRADDGTIYYAPGAWRDAKDQDAPEPQALSSAKPSPGGVVNAEGERENTGLVNSPGVRGASPSASAPPPSSSSPPPATESGAPDSGGSSAANPDGGVGP
jgi:YXWGXW repeat-containing protein